MEIEPKWIKWNGGIVAPVGPARIVVLKLRDGTIMSPYPAEGIIWTHYGQSTDPVEYYVVEPPTLP
jgi:hypothetical protein